MATLILAKYAGREGHGTFESITDLQEVQAHVAKSQGTIWIVSNSGDARRVKVNGAVRTWKRDKSRIEIPVKYGMYEYATLYASDIAAGRIIREVTDNA